MKDEVFIRAGKIPMTKEYVRLLTIEQLDLSEACTFIDIGAGTGSVAIEAAVRYPQLKVLAIEEKWEGIELIAQNAEKFAVTNIKILHAKAPVDVSINQVDAIFIGGSGGNLAEIIHWSYSLLNDKGRLILNFILHENLMEALSVLESLSFETLDTTQLQVSNLTKLGKGHYFKPNNPTFMVVCQKGILDAEH